MRSRSQLTDSVLASVEHDVRRVHSLDVVVDPLVLGERSDRDAVGSGARESTSGDVRVVALPGDAIIARNDVCVSTARTGGIISGRYARIRSDRFRH
jgi:hypothetical protein